MLALEVVPGNDLIKIGKIVSQANDIARAINAIDAISDTARVMNGFSESSKVLAGIASGSKMTTKIDTGKDVITMIPDANGVWKQVDEMANASDAGQKLARIGRAKNKIKPDLTAIGDHSVYKRNQTTGEITNYKTYEANLYNPKGFQEIKGYDGIGAAHRNSITNQKIETPHVHDKTAPVILDYLNLGKSLKTMRR